MKIILTDMSFKFFLGYEPEYTDSFDSSVITKFRRSSLKNVGLGNTLISESLTIAKDLGLISRTEIIIVATHIKSKYCKQTVTYIFKRTSKELRIAIYEQHPDACKIFPKKNVTVNYKKERLCTEELIETIRTNKLDTKPAIKENLNLLKKCIKMMLLHKTIE